MARNIFEGMEGLGPEELPANVLAELIMEEDLGLNTDSRTVKTVSTKPLYARQVPIKRTTKTYSLSGNGEVANVNLPYRGAKRT